MGKPWQHDGSTAYDKFSFFDLSAATDIRQSCSAARLIGGMMCEMAAGMIGEDGRKAAKLHKDDRYCKN